MSDNEQKYYNQIICSKENERLEEIINGLSLELDELMENNMVVVDHVHDNPDLDKHSYPFSLARVNKIYMDNYFKSHQRFGWIRVTYFTLSLHEINPQPFERKITNSSSAQQE